ncbi:DUF1566 domain-containing protein [Bacteroidales bacterium OttesenSCG-928-A17]|nr:DUF1566 domain-containing protein [Bacteroidales bacterium OttesenSCG-928-A17]
MKKMKHFLLFVAILWIVAPVYAAIPEGISYQAVVRNATGVLMSNQSVSLRVSILQGDNQTKVYSETHAVTSNANGLVTIQIGTGSVLEGTFSSIDWSDGTIYTQVEIDPTGGSSYSISSTTQLLAVPYAFHSKSADELTGKIDYEELLNRPAIKDSVNHYGFSGSYNSLSDLPSFPDSIAIHGFSGDYNDLGGKPEGNADGDILYWEQNKWNILPIGLEGQVLGIASGKITWLEPSFANVSASTYQVGDIYYNNGIPEGIVFEVSLAGRYGKVMSFNEYAGKKWCLYSYKIEEEDKEAEFINATNTTDGLYNSNIVKGKTNWTIDYPAFFVCDNEGEGWYLPSTYEMRVIYENRSLLNKKLQDYSDVVSSDLLKLADGTVYWTSTESDQAYTNAIIFGNYLGEEETLMVSGSIEEFPKNEELLVRPVRRLTWTETTSKPVVDPIYSVGDIYYDIDNTTPIGIVYQTSNGGLHGKYISLDEAELIWAEEPSTEFDANDPEDGKSNCDIVTLREKSNPAIEWCLNKGEGWYLPSINELRRIFLISTTINEILSTLSDITVTPLNVSNSVESIYWSSTEENEDYTDAIAFGTFTDDDENEVSAGSDFNLKKIESHKVRAIRAF